MKNNPACLITGAAGGIGKAIAQKLSSLNHNLILVSKSKVKLEKLVIHLKKSSNVKITSYVCDLSSLKEIEKLLIKLRGKRIDILINNAAIFNVADFTKEKHSEMQEAINVNLLAPIMLCKSAIKNMKKRKKGKIIFIGSTSAYKGEKNVSTYCVSKHGLLGLSKSINDEFNRFNIQSTIISPGLVKTKLNVKKRNGQNYDTFTEPNEIAEYIAFLIQDHSCSFIPEIMVRRRFA